MKKLVTISLFFLFQLISAQPNYVFMGNPMDDIELLRPEWTVKNKIGVDLSEVAFVNWNSGGSNSISGLVGVESSANYRDKYFFWKNSLSMRYGVNKQESRELRKTEDLIEINSNISYKPDSLSNWFYSARLNFKSQFSNGYNYPDTTSPISRFMAPGYLFFGAGMEYGKNINELSFYFSPVTLKTTFVLDEDLANEGAFGVEPAILDSTGNVLVKGENIRKEVGILVTNSYEMEVFENIKLKYILSLYTDYINKFGNIDVDWKIDFDFKVNSFVKATLGSHLKYDNDVKTTKPSAIEGEFDEAGAKVQWKQFLGIGFELDF
ncbi:DUF3078 domain-containing protein [Yeosuana sp.]|uniref:DUF3078 domain-containing protein n=1 Tax=Yeosuana sp. TaxID=2529388 RepID=UPI004054DEE6|tara:strand:+ start:4993 stop:5958 length:966 start_codon:yes stop_codon:yes gene_type:complete